MNAADLENDAVYFSNLTADRAAEAMISSSNATMQCYGRLLATGFTDIAKKWLNSERDRGTPLTHVLYAFCQQHQNLLAVLLDGATTEHGLKKALAAIANQQTKGVLRKISALKEEQKNGQANG